MKIGRIPFTATPTLPVGKGTAARGPQQAVAAGDQAASRYSLPPDDPAERRKWVKTTFLAANSELASANPKGLATKKTAMLESCFRFYRGSATLFMLDLAKYAPPAHDEPNVRMLVDGHAENYGTYRTAKNHLVYDINDFDEVADKGPFSWDVMRGATSWILAAREAGHSADHQKEVAEAYISSFVKQLHQFARHGGAEKYVVDLDNAEGPVKDLLKKMDGTDEGKWVGKITAAGDDGHHHFVKSDVITSRSDLAEKLEAASPLIAKAHVEDVAAKSDSGTASLGLPRWYLLEHASNGPEKVLEAKEELRSAADGVPFITVRPTQSRAAQVAAAATSMVVEPYPQVDSFLISPKDVAGVVPPEGRDKASFLVRERPALKGAVDELSLKTNDMISVARTQARLMAAEMARQPGKARAIDVWLGAHKDWADDTLKRCSAAASRVATDYETFKKL